MHAEDRTEALKKVKRLTGIAEDLRNGFDFPITRLTVLKGLCADPIAAARFGLHLTKLAKAKAKKPFRPLIERAIRQIHTHFRKPTPAATEAL
ncbi:MAG: hypothetical protein V3W34_07815 [Phycisphaerae bacterium]